MYKKFFALALLYTLPAYTSATLFLQQAPAMAVNFPGLSALDNTGLVDVGRIVDFRTKISRMAAHKLDKIHALNDYIVLSQEEALPAEDIQKITDMYLKHFLKISQKYFQEIKHLKPILTKLIATWAHQRSLDDSLVLLWASIESGKEEQFVKEYTPTLAIFHRFLTDLDILLADIMHSCPKTYAHYLECRKLIEEKHQHHDA